MASPVLDMHDLAADAHRQGAFHEASRQVAGGGGTAGGRAEQMHKGERLGPEAAMMYAIM